MSEPAKTIRIDDAMLCATHLHQALRQHGAHSLHVEALRMSKIGGLYEIPGCQHGDCESESLIFRVWPVEVGATHE